MKNLDWGSFITNIMAVVLGIFITFGIQGLIDRKAEKKDVVSALELVREELINNRSSLQEAVGIVASENSAAEFFSANAGNFSRFDADTLIAINAGLCTEYFFTVTDDALQLLKTSSLFQKLNDNNLALSIIKAYDFLNANSQAFNTHEKNKTALIEEANTDKAKRASVLKGGVESLKVFYSSPEAGYSLKSIIEMTANPFMEIGVEEIDATIAELDARLDSKKRQNALLNSFKM